MVAQADGRDSDEVGWRPRYVLSPRVARANPCFAEVRLSAWVSPFLPPAEREACAALAGLEWAGGLFSLQLP